jgi:hypothetical protein
MNEEKEREIVTVVECRKIQILPLQGGREGRAAQVRLF